MSAHFTCANCGTQFSPERIRLDRPPKYCSRRCSNEGQTRRVERICSQCGKGYSVTLAHARKTTGDVRGSFCSMACYGAWQNANIAGEASINFVPDNQATRSSLTWKLARKAIME